ncbi:hypothetical protein [Prosthecomicrobium hirschii]|uniref:hypothetical protein n=1 Tax=Prosthecodimorpha hirschii TaxID=665126 RepID=UPI00221FAA8E|nr:hypothetical protein [Prosthecomicrobium hirschii]MCW1844185.1 hypothetical protein [Prosthecomicrobium hirschii]
MTGRWRGWVVLVPLLTCSVISNSARWFGAALIAAAGAMHCAEDAMSEWAIGLGDPLERKAMLASEILSGGVRMIFVGFLIGLVSGAIGILIAAMFFRIFTN